MYGLQLVVVSAGQLPKPSQVAAAVATLLLQLAARQEVVFGACWHDALAAHNPVLPHTGPVVQRASAPPTFTAAQVPLAAPVRALEQAMHVPVQALLQHTPSTQAPEPH
jgi:hypothetical protein